MAFYHLKLSVFVFVHTKHIAIVYPQYWVGQALPMSMHGLHEGHCVHQGIGGNKVPLLAVSVALGTGLAVP